MNPKIQPLKKSLTDGMLSNFMPLSQCAVLKELLDGEESECAIDVLTKLEFHILAMPMTYEQDGLGTRAVVWLHYFHCGTDAWITERDCGTDPDDQRQQQAFGKVCLNRDKNGAEMGYISIQELIENDMELDLHWENKMLKDLA